MINSSKIQSTSLFISQFIYCIWLETCCLIGIPKEEWGLTEAEREAWFVCHYFIGPIPPASAHSHHDEPLYGRIQVTGLTKLGHHEEQEESAQHALGRHRGQRELNWSMEKGSEHISQMGSHVVFCGGGSQGDAVIRMDGSELTRLFFSFSPHLFFCCCCFVLPTDCIYGFARVRSQPRRIKKPIIVHRVRNPNHISLNIRATLFWAPR